MFVFWSKRTILIRRLLKAQVREEHETKCEAQEDSSRTHRTTKAISNDTSNVTQPTTGKTIGEGASSSGAGFGSGGGGATTAAAAAAGGGRVCGGVGSGSGSGGTCCGIAGNTTPRALSNRLHQGCCGGDQSCDDDERPGPSRLLRCKELLKTLKDNQLEMLLSPVESYGADLGSCVLVPRRYPFDDYESEEHHYQQQQQQQQYFRHHHPYNHHFQHLHHHHHHCNGYIGDTMDHCKCHHSLEEEEDDEDERQNSSEGSCSPIREDSCVSDRLVTTMPVRANIDNATMDPHLLCCQFWRWPDLTHTSELKRLPVCHSAKDPVYVCCNPYHWSRLCKPESPPPPYCLVADRLRPEDRAPSEGDQRRFKNNASLRPLPGSLTTNGEGEIGQKEWCTLAYWELGGRVGRLYPVEPLTVNVFDSLHDGDGLCLATLAENHTAPPTVQRTRSKIGLGLMLSQEEDGVWAYNRSGSPIFVNSPTLEDPELKTFLVYRVPPGFCLNIFDRSKIMQHPYDSNDSSSGANGVGTVLTTRTNISTTSGFSSGPVDINSVRISFAKGWGPKYSRQEVTSCPCWLEVLLAPCR